MSLNEMSAEPRGCRERSFEIHEVSGFFLAERCAAQSFTGHVRRKMMRVKFDDRETAAIYRDTVAPLPFDGDFARAGEAHEQPTAPRAIFDRFNRCDVFRDSSKHRESILPPRNRRRTLAELSSRVTAP